MTTARLSKVGPKAWLAAAAAALVALGIALGVVLGTGSSDPYMVRAIFDDAANLTIGEQVKIAGVPVGSVEAIEPTWHTPTGQAKAAVVMSITREGFQDFRADASCTIRPQSLLGEKYVDCVPTQPHPPGAQPAPPLKVIPAGQEGAGDRLLPLQNTSSPVDPDLPTDINHLPERERLRIILNELGAGLEGRGSDLHEVILRANPALRETNKVLRILANENRVLAKLAVDSDRALAPLAEVRGKVADFLVQSNTLASASARHSAALERNLRDFPPFLEQLGPAMERIGHFGEETTPTMRELGLAAPGVNRLFAAIPAFSSASTKYFTSLGSFGKVAGPAFKGSEPLLERLEALGRSIKPFSGNLGTLLESLRETGGIERLMDFIYLTAGATNGYNALGHFLRANLVSVALCTPYVAIARGRCSANFSSGESTSGKKASAGAAAAEGTLASIASVLAALPGGAQPGATRTGTSSGAGATGRSGGASVSGVGGTSARGLLLNYLLGE
jgi:phospholipid/cholesterol/gamma-HCH transport system substrate-binding protein